jgi:antitoxin FitA
MSAMSTLYIREVPDAVAETLKKRAAIQGQSLSAYVSAELSKLASRPTNDEVVARLRKLDRHAGPTTDEIVAAVQDGRR